MTETFSRAAGVLSAGLDGELVLYDPRSQDAHTLDAEATRVWEALAEPADLAALIERTGLSEDQVLATLAQLAELSLLEAPAEQHNGVGRREVLRRGAMLAAAGVGLPTVASLAVPGLAAAASTPSTTGNPGTGGNGGTSNPKPGLPIQQGPTLPPPYSINLGYRITYRSTNIEAKSAGGQGFYAYSTRNSKGYYAQIHQSYASPGQPVSNASYGTVGDKGLGYKLSPGGGNHQCQHSSKSEPCTTYYAGVQGAAVCASYGSPYVCTGSRLT